MTYPLRVGLVVNLVLLVVAAVLSVAHEFAAVGPTRRQIRRAVIDDIRRSWYNLGFGLYLSAGSAVVGCIPFTAANLDDHAVFVLTWTLIAVTLIGTELAKSRLVTRSASPSWTVSRLLAMPAGLASCYWVWSGAQNSAWPFAVALAASLVLASLIEFALARRRPSSTLCNHVLVACIKGSSTTDLPSMNIQSLHELLSRAAPTAISVPAEAGEVIVIAAAPVTAALKIAESIISVLPTGSITVAIDGAVWKRQRSKAHAPELDSVTASAVAQTAAPGVWLSLRYLTLLRQHAHYRGRTRAVVDVQGSRGETQRYELHERGARTRARTKPGGSNGGAK